MVSSVELVASQARRPEGLGSDEYRSLDRTGTMALEAIAIAVDPDSAAAELDTNHRPLPGGTSRAPCDPLRGAVGVVKPAATEGIGIRTIAVIVVPDSQ